MIIGTNDSSPSSGLAFDLAPSLSLLLNIGLVSGTVTASTLADVASCVTPVIINSHTMFYYRKTVMTEDLTNLKFYIKGIIWIEEIPFSNTIEAENYMFRSSDNKRWAKVIKDLGHQFVFLAKKIEDGYYIFVNLVNSIKSQLV